MEAGRRFEVFSVVDEGASAQYAIEASFDLGALITSFGVRLVQVERPFPGRAGQVGLATRTTQPRQHPRAVLATGRAERSW